MNFDFLYFIAGLTIFIFGMMRVEASLKEMAGRPFKKFLQHQTKYPIRAILAGTTVTAVLQSSSVVLLMVLSFVGAGIMEMRNALAVVLGSNFGTTLDSWVVAIFGFKLEIEKLSYPILAIALIGFVISRNRIQIRRFSEFLVGFALLFIGLGWMKESASAFANPELLNVVTERTPYLFIPIGFLLTVIIQSSSATMAITLTALHAGIIPLEHAAAMVIGAELGTSIKIILGAVGGIPDKKRVALGNMYFNSVTLVIAAILLYPLLDLINLFLQNSDALIKLVVFQSSINLLSILIFFPFLRKFADFLDKKYVSEETIDPTFFIHNSSELGAADTLDPVEMEIESLFRHAIQLNRIGFAITDEQNSDAWYKNLKRFTETQLTYEEQYQRIKLLQGEILEYIQNLQQQKFEKEQLLRLNSFISICREVTHAVKNIKDIRHNLMDLADSAHDEYYDLYIQLQEREKIFYTTIEEIISNRNQGEKFKSRIDDLSNFNQEEQEKEISKLFFLLRENKISELKISTMLNVYREVYSSHKAFLKAISVMQNVAEEEI